MTGLSHFDDSGQAHMVDVSEKDVTKRAAIAEARVIMGDAALAALKEGDAKKGDVIGVARLAGIMGAKQTSNLIPLCHPLPITKVAIDFTIEETGVHIAATVRTTGQTGVEMEALTAVSIAALTVYDMLKAVDKTMTITDTRLLRKEGGKSGVFEAGR